MTKIPAYRRHALVALEPFPESRPVDPDLNDAPGLLRKLQFGADTPDDLPMAA